MHVATILDFLDDHAGALTALLTVLLVAITCYYAWQNRKMAHENRRMVEEMRQSRELSVRPKLAVKFHRLAPTAVTVAIKNVGQGPAIDVDVTFVYEGRQGKSDEQRPWRSTFLGSGEQHDFLPPGNLDGNLNSIPEDFERIRLRGSMMDALGAEHEVDEVFADLKEWREILGGARERYVSADPERRLAEALKKQFESPLRDLSLGLQHVAGVIATLADEREEHDDEQ